MCSDWMGVDELMPAPLLLLLRFPSFQVGIRFSPFFLMRHLWPLPALLFQSTGMCLGVCVRFVSGCVLLGRCYHGRLQK